MLMLSFYMRPITELSKTDIKNIKLIAFDSDGVLVKKGTEIIQSSGFYSQKTNIVDPQVIAKLNELKKYFHVVINNGRILSGTKTLESQGKMIDPETDRLTLLPVYS